MFDNYAACMWCFNFLSKTYIFIYLKYHESNSHMLIEVLVLLTKKKLMFATQFHWNFSSMSRFFSSDPNRGAN